KAPVTTTGASAARGLNRLTPIRSAPGRRLLPRERRQAPVWRPTMKTYPSRLLPLVALALLAGPLRARSAEPWRGFASDMQRIEAIARKKPDKLKEAERLEAQEFARLNGTRDAKVAQAALGRLKSLAAQKEKAMAGVRKEVEVALKQLSQKAPY